MRRMDGGTDKNCQTIAVTLHLRFAARVNQSRNWKGQGLIWFSTANTAAVLLYPLYSRAGPSGHLCKLSCTIYYMYVL